MGIWGFSRPAGPNFRRFHVEKVTSLCALSHAEWTYLKDVLASAAQRWDGDRLERLSPAKLIIMIIAARSLFRVAKRRIHSKVIERGLGPSAGP